MAKYYRAGTSGNDTIMVGNRFFKGFDGWKVEAGAGDDTVVGSSMHDLLFGQAGNDYLYGGAGNDEIDGGTYDDQLFGQGGEDKLFGGEGNDFLYGDRWGQISYGDYRDELHGGAGTDWLYGDGGDDDLFGGSEDDTLFGGSGGDHLDGGLHNDNLYGHTHEDELIGGEGNDNLYGGDHSDTLTGGAGADVFHFLRDETGIDRITDFNGLRAPSANPLLNPSPLIPRDIINLRDLMDLETDFSGNSAADAISQGYLHFVQYQSADGGSFTRVYVDRNGGSNSEQLNQIAVVDVDNWLKTDLENPLNFII